MPYQEPQSGPEPRPADEAPALSPLAFRAPRPGVAKRALLGLFLLGALGVMAVNFLHPGRAQRLRALDATDARLSTMMLTLEHDNDRLMNELKRLERGAEGWQALARKEYGMVLPGEVVYRFPPDEQP